MLKCPECPQEPKLEHCQACYLAEKMRRERLEKNLAELLYHIDKLIGEVKKI